MKIQDNITIAKNLKKKLNEINQMLDDKYKNQKIKILVEFQLGLNTKSKTVL